MSPDTDDDWIGSMFYVQVEWENGETNYEPQAAMAADDPNQSLWYMVFNIL